LTKRIGLLGFDLEILYVDPQPWQFRDPKFSVAIQEISRRLHKKSPFL